MCGNIFKDCVIEGPYSTHFSNHSVFSWENLKKTARASSYIFVCESQSKSQKEKETRKEKGIATHKSNRIDDDSSEEIFAERFVKSRLDEAIAGVSQGYSANLQLLGIGFNGKLEEQKNTCRSSKLCEKQTNTIGSALELAHRATHGKNGVIPKKIGTQVTEKSEANENKYLIMNVGLSHEITYHIPKNSVVLTISSSVSNLQSKTGATINTANVPTISIFGISKSKVNQVAANIYRHKKPEPYKGKGIRYSGEKFYIKNTDSAKKSG